MINTVLRNIISNSIKFSYPHSYVEVSISIYPKDKKYLQIKVKDFGVGIPQDVIPKLFSIDVKTSTKGTHKESGTGLGLILCNEFIEKHKCSI